MHSPNGGRRLRHLDPEELRPAAEPAPPLVLTELARGILLGFREDDREQMTRFATQFLRDQQGSEPPGSPGRGRTVRGPLARAAPDGRSLEPHESP